MIFFEGVDPLSQQGALAPVVVQAGDGSQTFTGGLSSVGKDKLVVLFVDIFVIKGYNVFEEREAGNQLLFFVVCRHYNNE